LVHGPVVSKDPIIVATALDAEGVTAIQEAAAWAERRGAPLVVAHALPSQAAIMPLLPHLVDVVPSPDLRDKAERALEEHVETALGDASAAERVVVEGSAHAAILELAERAKPQLVVVSHSEKAVIERAVLGSTAEQITRHAPCSVLVVRSAGATGPVLAATDLSDAAFPAVQMAGIEATRRDAELVVVHALDVAQPFTALFEPTATLDQATVKKLSEAADELLQAIVSRAGHPGSTAVVLGPPARAVAEEAEVCGAALIVVATHGHSGLRHVLLGSIAEGVVRRAHCNVLVVRGHTP